MPVRSSESTAQYRTGLSRLEKPFSIDVGRFVMEGTVLSSPAFLPDATSFLNSLQANVVNGPKKGLVPFVDLKYFWDDAAEYTGEKDIYINAVELGMSIDYGNTLTLFMDGNIWQPQRVSDIPPIGYGNAARYLAQWIIKASAFLPSVQSMRL
ncbi:hypothetical protein H2198_006525 [Neophaeococcomyces mojaviensis]|uniref:Uncharacterized protein n=1 Tax=Neophaeococcomyces mojaviensis TaxID=3383035 RepID=A0ACC3A2Q4_9EURO|nr:hypothetical protein H2198_006525 [Knufia sp. JES_112]